MTVFSGPLSAAPSISAQTMMTTSGSNTGNSSSSTMQNMVLNLGTPLYITHDRITGTTNITQNVVRVTFENNGTLMLPNGRNVSTIESEYDLLNTTGGLVRITGQSLIKTADGKESATIAFTSFAPTSLTMGMGIGMAYMKTNSNTTSTAAGQQQQQQLALLNDTLMVYAKESKPQTGHIATYWKWK